MKKRLFLPGLCAAVLGLGLTGPPAAHAQLGVTAGFNFNRLTDIALNDVDTNFDNKNGWHVGIWTEFSVLGVLTLRPGARYMEAGQLFEGLSEIDGRIDDDFDVNLVEFPILLRLDFGAPAVKPYVLAGPVIRLTTGIDERLNNDVRSPTLAAEVGLGIEIPFGILRLYPEIAYTFGLSNFIDDEIIIGFSTFSTDDAQRLNAAMLRLGVGF